MFDSTIRAVSVHKDVVIAATAVALIAGIVLPVGEAVAQQFPITIALDDILVEIAEYRVSVDVGDIVSIDIGRTLGLGSGFAL